MDNLNGIICENVNKRFGPELREEVRFNIFLMLPSFSKFFFQQVHTFFFFTLGTVFEIHHILTHRTLIYVKSSYFLGTLSPKIVRDLKVHSKRRILKARIFYLKWDLNHRPPGCQASVICKDAVLELINAFRGMICLKCNARS